MEPALSATGFFAMLRTTRGEGLGASAHRNDNIKGLATLRALAHRNDKGGRTSLTMTEIGG